MESILDLSPDEIARGNAQAKQEQEASLARIRALITKQPAQPQASALEGAGFTPEMIAEARAHEKHERKQLGEDY